MKLEPEDCTDAFGRIFHRMQEAKKWLAVRDLNLERGIIQVREASEEYESLKAVFRRFDDLIVDAALRGEITIVGCRRDFTTGKLDEMPKEIESIYFARPVCHAKGIGILGIGELSGLPHTYDALLNAFVDREPRATYQAVLLKRDDVKILSAHYETEIFEPLNARVALPPIPRSTISLAALKRWYRDYVKRQVEARRRPSRVADWEAAKEAFPNKLVRQRMVYALRRNLAPDDWKNPGRRPKN